MDYKVMKRPMFRMGGPTSGGTGITSGLDTPKRGLVDGPGGYAGFDLNALLEKRTAAYDKLGTGLENQMSSVGPMAAYSAIAGGALDNVNSIGDLAMAFGKPSVLKSVVSGMGTKNQLQSKVDALDLSKIDSDIKTGLAIQKAQKAKQYEYKERLKDVDGLEMQISKIKQIETEGLVGDVLDKKLIELQSNKQIQELNKKIDFLLREMSLDEYLYKKEIEASKNDMLFDIDAATEMYYKIKNKKADGGRINKAMGGGFDMGQEQPMQAAQTMAPEPQMMQPQGGGQAMGEDPFQILRARLPQEITDDVVALIAYNKAAFQDFANLQDQDDVDLFNQKYNVQLVVDLASR